MMNTHHVHKRHASHAGSWYEARENKLNMNINGFLDANVAIAEEFEHAKLKALIGPHAGYRFCGPVMGAAYATLKHASTGIRRVVLLGPSHCTYTNKCVLPAATEYCSPMGNLYVDEELVSQLESTGIFDKFTIQQDEEEHSLEMHLPFIVQTLGTNVKLLPIIVGHLSASADRRYAELLAPILDDQSTICIVSSDFCHWGRRFRYTRYNKHAGEIWQSIEKLDREAMQIIEQLNASEFRDYLRKTENTICGRQPILLLLEILSMHGAHHTVKFLAYDQSERVCDPNGSSVSYAAAAITVV